MRIGVLRREKSRAMEYVAGAAMFIYICIYICSYVCIYVYMCVCVYIYIGRALVDRKRTRSTHDDYDAMESSFMLCG